MVVVQCLHHLLIRRQPHIAAISTFSSHSLHPHRNCCTRRFASFIPFNSYQQSISTQGGTVQHNANENDGVVMDAIDANPPRGTRDFTPEDMRLRNWLFQNFREVSEDWGLNWEFICLAFLLVTFLCDGCRYRPNDWFVCIWIEIGVPVAFVWRGWFPCPWIRSSVHQKSWGRDYPTGVCWYLSTLYQISIHVLFLQHSLWC